MRRYKRRIVVEWTFGWLHSYRRRPVRHEFYDGFLHLASALIAIGRLRNRFLKNVLSGLRYHAGTLISISRFGCGCLTAHGSRSRRGDPRHATPRRRRTSQVKENDKAEVPEETRVRPQTLREFRNLVEGQGQCLLIPSEKIAHALQTKPLPMRRRQPARHDHFHRRGRRGRGTRSAHHGPARLHPGPDAAGSACLSAG